MTKLAIAFGVSLAAVAPLAGQTKKPATTTTSAQGGRWIQLFNGKDLNGWRGYQKPDTSETRWKVEDGMLTITRNVVRAPRGRAISLPMLLTISSICAGNGRSLKAATAA